MTDAVDQFDSMCGSVELAQMLLFAVNEANLLVPLEPGPLDSFRVAAGSELVVLALDKLKEARGFARQISFGDIPNYERSLDKQQRGQKWSAYLAEYERLKAIEDALPVGSANDDEVQEARNAAFDALMQVPVPDAAVLGLKLKMAIERCDELPLFDEYRTALLADCELLAGVAGSGGAA